MRWPAFDPKRVLRTAAIVVAAAMLTACAGSNVVADKSRRFDQATAAYDAGDYTAAYSIWSRLADENDLAAMRNAAHMLRRGLGVEKNPGRALDLYTESARKGLVLAMANVAEMHMNGEGTLKDPEEAARWYELAARGGLSIAMVRLAEMYDQGLGVKRDPARAQELYDRAAKNGYSPARDKLASAQQAPSEAVRSTEPPASVVAVNAPPPVQSSGMRKSAPVVDEFDRRSKEREPRRPAAQIPQQTGKSESPPQDGGNMAPVDQNAIAGLSDQDAQKLQAGWVAYQSGHMRDALKLWRSLADKGVPGAQIRVGAMFESGLGVGRDLIEAYRWYRTAASKNDLSASAAASRVAAQLSPAERAIAESMATSPDAWPRKTR
jgi:uncharacterized protein